MTFPDSMRAVQLSAYDGRSESISVARVPVPTPRHGEVLIKMTAAPINPSDLMFVRGLYGFQKPAPAIPGFEGSGTVVASGGGLMAQMLHGKRVACAAADPANAGGTWAEYLVTSANFCVPLAKHVTDEQGAMMLVNPLTAWALMQKAKRGRHRAVVQTAAASALGRMISRLARSFSLPMIDIVRRAEQVELLRSCGCKYVLNSSDTNFDRDLHAFCHDLNATIAFDAVAGEMPARVLRAQPRRSRMIVYGALSLQAVQVDPASLIFEDKRVEGFWLSAWLRNMNLLKQLRVTRQIQRHLKDDLRSEVRERVPLEKTQEALQQYASNMTRGKILIVP
jgi:NADPH:quinone reductase